MNGIDGNDDDRQVIPLNIYFLHKLIEIKFRYFSKTKIKFIYTYFNGFSNK